MVRAILIKDKIKKDKKDDVKEGINLFFYFYLRKNRFFKRFKKFINTPY
jgi:hypothetical protein